MSPEWMFTIGAGIGVGIMGGVSGLYRARWSANEQKAIHINTAGHLHAPRTMPGWADMNT